MAGFEVATSGRFCGGHWGKGKAQNKVWLAAPIYRLQDIPEDAFIEDPETHERISMRTIVVNNASHNYFYLPAFPFDHHGTQHYVDFRKIASIGIEFFVSAKNDRLATLTEESLNLLYSRSCGFSHVPSISFDHSRANAEELFAQTFASMGRTLMRNRGSESRRTTATRTGST